MFRMRFALAAAIAAVAVSAGFAFASDECIEPYIENGYSSYCYYTCYTVLDSSSQHCRDNSGLSSPVYSHSAMPGTWPGHGTDANTMYPVSIGQKLVFSLDQYYNIDGMHIWNFNETKRPGGFGPHKGINGCTIEVTTDTTLGTWTRIGSFTLKKASGQPNDPGQTVMWGTTQMARFVRVTVDSSFSQSEPGGGLSELRFLGTPAGLAGVANPSLGTLALAPVWPNPSHGAARLSFTLPRASSARLDVLDLQGRLVTTLADGDLAAGAHELAWDGRRTDGARALSGVYFARLVAGTEVSKQKFMLLQ